MVIAKFFPFNTAVQSRCRFPTHASLSLLKISRYRAGALLHSEISLFFPTSNDYIPLIWSDMQEVYFRAIVRYNTLRCALYAWQGLTESYSPELRYSHATSSSPHILSPQHFTSFLSIWALLPCLSRLSLKLKLFKGCIVMLPMHRLLPLSWMPPSLIYYVTDARFFDYWNIFFISFWLLVAEIYHFYS